MKESIFEERTPEAAARQMAVVLAWLTECELATLERMKELKTSKYALKRQEDICDQAVAHCVDLKVEPRGLRGRSCPRLQKLMELKKD